MSVARNETRSSLFGLNTTSFSTHSYRHDDVFSPVSVKVSYNCLCEGFIVLC